LVKPDFWAFFDELSPFMYPLFIKEEEHMKFIDGFLLPVPIKHKDDYIAMSEKIADIYKKHGALSICETWSNEVPEGKLTSMHLAVKREEDEGIVFSWVTWPNKELRDEAHPKVVDDMHKELEGMDIPFDGKRMIFGGFDVIVDR